MGDKTVSGLLPTGKEKAHARYDKCLVCGWDYVKKNLAITVILTVTKN
jgi:hypothetical protein